MRLPTQVPHRGDDTRAEWPMSMKAEQDSRSWPGPLRPLCDVMRKRLGTPPTVADSAERPRLSPERAAKM